MCLQIKDGIVPQKWRVNEYKLNCFEKIRKQLRTKKQKVLQILQKYKEKVKYQGLNSLLWETIWLFIRNGFL